jgi:hypothetical protein
MVGEYRLSTSTGVEPSAHHHGSHRQLLTGAETVEVKPGQVDAIIVPTARPVAYLRQAIALADQLGCTLLVLCSKLAKAPDAAKAGKESRVSIVAIDTDSLPSGLVPNFKTSAVLRGNRFNRRTDTSIKRNLGLLLAEVAGWERIVFLDDDITVPRPDDLLDAAGLLASHAAVGLSNGGYPDNSVVCHAYREAGGPQDTFIGGGALAVGAASFTSFFPNIYNEDWFFLLDDDRLRPSTVTGLAVQSPYDPFSDVRRARSEELGDCLAEGVFSLLDTGGRVQDADARYWRGFLDKRRRFIDDVLCRVQSADNDLAEKARMIAALKAARGRNQFIEPELCVDYLRVWRTDRDLWRRHLDEIGRKHGHGMTLDKVLADLGLMHC